MNPLTYKEKLIYKHRDGYYSKSTSAAVCIFQKETVPRKLILLFAYFCFFFFYRRCELSLKRPPISFIAKSVGFVCTRL